MPNISKEGTYSGRIVDAFMRETKFKEDPDAFTVVCKFETPDGFHAYYDLIWSHHNITSGKNKGKTSADVSEILLKSLGVADGYLPNFRKMIEDGANIECTIVMKWDEYMGKDGNTKKALRCKYLNPPRREANIRDVDLEEMLAKFKGSNTAKSDDPAKDSPVVDEVDTTDYEKDSTAEGSDEIPF